MLDTGRIIVKLETLLLDNFKTFKHQEITFDKLTVIIGENASGKTNLLWGIRFLKDIANHGLYTAVAMAGGRYFPRRIGDGSSMPTRVKITLDGDMQFPQKDRTKSKPITFKKVSYSISVITTESEQNGWAVTSWSEELVFHGIKTDEELGDILITQSSQTPDKSPDMEGTGHVTDEIINKVFPVESRDWLNHRWEFGDIKDSEQISFLNSGRISPLSHWLDQHIRFYNPLPFFTQSITELSGNSNLTETGANVADVLENIERLNRSSQVISLIQRLFPWVDSVKSIQLSNGGLTWGIQERGLEEPTPARILSPGQIRGMALVLALFQANRSDVLILEEPEQYLHPSMLGPFLALVTEIIDTYGCQIVFTTQQPEILAQLSENQEVLLVRRGNKERNSKVYNLRALPALNDWVKNLGIANLYIDNFLESLFTEDL